MPPVNDTYIANNWVNNDALTLVDANCAWSITTGDSNILIGIADTEFEEQHEDLVNQIDRISGPHSGYHYHGTRVYGVAGSQTNNSLGIAGIGYNCRGALERINHSAWGMAWSGDIERAIWNLYLDSVPIINVSWTGTGLDPIAAKEIVEHSVIVLGAGNSPNGNNHSAIADIPGVILVSGVDHTGAHGPTGHRHNQWVDLCAQSTNVTTTDTSNGYTGDWGTSFAAPMVSGTVGLMLSVNDCLSPRQVEDILESTANPILDAANYPNQVGSGYLNAYRAVKAAQDFHSNTLDLYMRDRLDDIGYDAGYTWTWEFDDSPDIWVRNQDDGLVNQSHESPEYQSSNPVYVYVRVGNKSCVPSTGNEKLALYWSKAATNSSWPLNWNGSDPSVGNKINDMYIPILQPGQDTILKFSWNILPQSGIGSTWNNCLLARIENSTIDPITVYPGDQGQDVYQNNNVAMKNLIVTNYIPGSPHTGEGTVGAERYFYIGNSNQNGESYNIIFGCWENDLYPISEAAEITVHFDQQGWSIISPLINDREDIHIRGSQSFTIMGNQPVVLDNVFFPGNFRIPVKLSLNFLIEKVDVVKTYDFHVVQKKSGQHPIFEDHWTGGVHFRTNIGSRDAFAADAGEDKDINKGETVVLAAEQINESAVYNWYDENGILIHTGTDLTVSPEHSEQYLLEVISNADGFKDYDEVMVQVDRFKLNSLTPNPASDQLTVDYDVQDANSAYLMVVGTNPNSICNNYILNINQTQIVLDLNNYPIGAYTIALVVDGHIVDTEGLIVQ